MFLLVPVGSGREVQVEMGKSKAKGSEAAPEKVVQGAGKSLKAGLILPIARVNKKLKKRIERVGQGAPVYLTAVLEYISGEVIELALKSAGDRQVKRITAKDLSYAIRSDKELNKLFEGYSIFCGDKMDDIMEAVTTDRDLKEREKKKQQKKQLKSVDADE